MKNLKLFILIFALFLFTGLNYIYSIEKTFLIYHDLEYYLSPISLKEIPVDEFEPLSETDNSQIHRMILTASDKTKLQSLLYVGDKLQLNDVEISLVYNEIYQIKDLTNKITLKFSIGDRSEILIKSAINFKIDAVTKDYKAIKTDASTIKHSLDFDDMDKLASTILVEEMFVKLNALPEVKEVKENKNKQEINKKLVNSEYDKFIENLAVQNKKEILKNLTRFVEINLRVSGNKKITEDWTSPANIFFFKEGDYKSIALFYYYTLKRIDEINIRNKKPPYYLFNPKGYFVLNLEKRPKNETDTIIAMFSSQYKSSDDLERIQLLQMQYKYVNLNEELNYNSSRPSYSKPQSIYFFKAPKFSESTFLVTVNIEDKWIYTTGEKWTSANISIPERSCANYSQNGCYYAFVDNDMAIINNQPIQEKEVLWNVFYGLK